MRSTSRPGLAAPIYPPGCFHPDVIRDDLFEELCPTADDIWLYWMARLNGYQFAHTGRMGFTLWPQTQNEMLFAENVGRGQNDVQIENMLAHYGSGIFEPTSPDKGRCAGKTQTRDKEISQAAHFPCRELPCIG